MRLSRLLMLLTAAVAMHAQVWDTSGNSKLNGTYYFRQVYYVLDTYYNDDRSRRPSLFTAIYPSTETATTPSRRPATRRLPTTFIHPLSMQPLALSLPPEPMASRHRDMDILRAPMPTAISSTERFGERYLRREQHRQRIWVQRYAGRGAGSKSTAYRLQFHGQLDRRGFRLLERHPREYGLRRWST